jgi:hypothetical protein
MTPSLYVFDVSVNLSGRSESPGSKWECRILEITGQKEEAALYHLNLLTYGHGFYIESAVNLILYCLRLNLFHSVFYEIKEFFPHKKHDLNPEVLTGLFVEDVRKLP